MPEIEPTFRIVRGTPNAEELAALVGVLVRRSAAVAAPVEPVVSRWARSGRPDAGPRPGRHAWRAAALPHR